MITLLAFAFALGVIIVVHEAGHLWVAKACKVRVLAFSVGFGKRIWGFERNGTDYRLSLLPLGGYVKLSGEGIEDQPATDDPHDFQNRPRWQRILVYLAGPAMNVIFSFLLFAVLFTIGIDVQRRPAGPATVGAVPAGSSAAAAGLAPGDVLKSVDGKAVSGWNEAIPALTAGGAAGKPMVLTVERGGQALPLELAPAPAGSSLGIVPDRLPRFSGIDEKGRAFEGGARKGDVVRAMDGLPVKDHSSFRDYVSARPEKPISFEIERGGQVLTLPITPRKDGDAGRVGAGLAFYEHHPFSRSFAESAGYNGYIVRETGAVLQRIVTGKTKAQNALSGPVGIAGQAGAAARSGFKDLLHLMGVLSLSIALLNLLPIPLLDGGQVLILLVESAIRRDLPAKMKEIVSYAGLGAVVLLMLFTFWVDIARIFGL